MSTQPTSQSVKRNGAIDKFLSEHAHSEHQDLLAEMMVTICRLAKDHTGRGELKIINTALKEMRYAFKVFAPYEGTPKVTIFGSSRTPADHPDYAQARDFAERMERCGWMVITGAGDGIMRAGHHGAKRESSFGVAISLPFEQQTNDIILDDPKCVKFKYFFTRKLQFIKEAEAVVLFPGGFGTLDEGFEALTLIQTGKADMIPVVMVDTPGATYWSHWERYVRDELLAKGMISAEDLHLFRITSDVDEAVAQILQFYHRYHSMRMVRELLAIRLKTALPPAEVDRLSDLFSDILLSGRIEQVAGPLDGERAAFPALPRLVLHFNRRSFGRLRLLVDEVNRL